MSVYNIFLTRFVFQVQHLSGHVCQPVFVVRRKRRLVEKQEQQTQEVRCLYMHANWNDNIKLGPILLCLLVPPTAHVWKKWWNTCLSTLNIQPSSLGGLIIHPSIYLLILTWVQFMRTVVWAKRPPSPPATKMKMVWELLRNHPSQVSEPR